MTASTKDTATIATLSVKLDGAIAQISELKNQFLFFQTNFTPKEIYNIKHEELVKQVTTNTSDIQHLYKNQSHNVSWVWPLITFIMGGVMLFLIDYALTH